MVNKAKERVRLKTQLKNLAPDYRQNAEHIIHQRLIDFLKARLPQKIAIYLSKDNEVSTDYIYDWLEQHHWEVYAPRIEGSEMRFYRVAPHRENLVWKEHFKIWEPQPTVAAIDFPIMIVPLIGYNQKGYRLGHGQGYYDRWLQRHRPKLTIGLAYTEQLAHKNLIFTNFDVPLDWIITNGNMKKI